MACSDAPDGRARWTVRLLAEQAIKRKIVPQVGRETIRILLESHDLKPWREKMWCVSELNEEYVRKLEDVLELYERPYNQAEPVVCVDEKPVTLHKDVRSPRPPVPGQIAKRDSEYERCGTANVFCAVEPKAGRHYTRPTPDRCAAEFAQIMAELAAQLSNCADDSPGRRQSKHPLPEVPYRLLWGSSGGPPLEPLHGSLYAQAR